MTAIETDFARFMGAVATELLGKPSTSSKKELRYGRNGSLSIDLLKGTFFDHETKKGGGVLDLIAREAGTSANGGAVDWLRAHGFTVDDPAIDQPIPSKRKIDATYDYQDEMGADLFQVVRYRPKTFLQRRKAGPDDPPEKVKDGWVWSVQGTRLVPYKLPELIEALALDRPVFIVEGEKDVENLARLGVTATCNPMGAGKWQAEFADVFRGADVIVIPDNDEAGRKHRDLIGSSISGVVSRLRVLDLPGLPEKGDVSDWIAAGGTADALHKLVDKQARPWSALDQAAAPAAPLPPRIRLLSSAAFIKGFTPPDYVIDGVLQRGFLYALTGKTGSGKTAVALFIAYCKATGRSIAGRETSKGRVLFLAAENPDDVRMRWIAMAHAFGFDPNAIDVHFVDGVFKISEAEGALREEVDQVGPFDLVIVDTGPAFFEGTEENDNVGMGKHARTLRRLTTLPGRPAVIVNCHPVKNAGDDNLIPRGGGAFLAEIDGNLTCTEKDKVIEVHWAGKFRGVEFAPLPFRLVTVRTDSLMDSRGRQIPSVVAQDLSAAEQADLERAAGREEDALLLVMSKHPAASIAALADFAGWRLSTGQPYKTKAKRLLDNLLKDKLVKQERKTWLLTPAGTKEAEKLQFKADFAGAVAHD